MSLILTVVDRASPYDQVEDEVAASAYLSLIVSVNCSWREGLSHSHAGLEGSVVLSVLQLSWPAEAV